MTAVMVAIGPGNELQVVRVDGRDAVSAEPLVRRYAAAAFASSRGKAQILVRDTGELEEPLPSGRPQEDVQLRGGEGTGRRLECRVWSRGSGWSGWRRV